LVGKAEQRAKKHTRTAYAQGKRAVAQVKRARINPVANGITDAIGFAQQAFRGVEQPNRDHSRYYRQSRQPDRQAV
jgi:hypothetical protein